MSVLIFPGLLARVGTVGTWLELHSDSSYLYPDEVPEGAEANEICQTNMGEELYESRGAKFREHYRKNG